VLAFSNSKTEISRLELEASTGCSVRCAGCARSVWGSDLVPAEFEPADLDPVHLMRLAELNLTQVLVNGNYGDFLSHPDPVELIETITTLWPRAQVLVSTHGSTGTVDFWRQLASLGITVQFGIDGLDQATHGKYRQESCVEQVLSNAAEFIAAGGTAHWSWIRFDHNQHQLEQARQQAIQLGFSRFHTVAAWQNSQAEPTPRVNNQLQVVDWLWPADQQNPAWPADQAGRQLSRRLKTQHVQGLIPVRPVDVFQHTGFSVRCPALERNQIYLNSAGAVFPCSHWAKPISWQNLLNLWQIPAEFNQLQHRYVSEILRDPFWDLLDQSLSTESPLNVCARSCGEKPGVSTGAEISWQKANRAETVWEHGFTPRQRSLLLSEFEQFYRTRFGITDPSIFSLTPRGDYQNLSVQASWDAFRTGCSAAHKIN
jgi:hypothetical protein